jgi:CRP-like cAMP-binding protein
MDQQLVSVRQATTQQLVPVDSPGCRKSDGLRCGLPLGKTMICGDARHRVDREPDSEVIVGGASNRDVWFIRSGILRLQRHAYDGRRQILSLYLPGEIVGFGEEFREGMIVETATPSGLCRIDRHKFDAMVDQNDVLRAELFRQKQDQLDRLHWMTWSLAALGPTERLSAFLALSTKFMPFRSLPDGTGVLSMLLPRRDIADLLGTTVESISRIVHSLDGDRAIEIGDPAHFKILDLPKLVALGKIEGLFDRMANSLAKRQSLDGLMVSGSQTPHCFCGR